MDFQRQAEIVDEIHATLTALTGSKIRVKANMGRSKVVEREGILTQTHPQLFIVEVEEKRGRTARQSYQYVDVLTGSVVLSDCESGEPLCRIFDN